MVVETTQYIEYHHAQPQWETQNYDQIHVQIAPQQIMVPQMSPEPKIEQLDVKQKTQQERSHRRKQATQREKRRMEKLNHCIEDIRSLVCPNMKTPTKAKILREAINRIQYLEKMTAELLGQKGHQMDHINVIRSEIPVLPKPTHVPVSTAPSVPVSMPFSVSEQKFVPIEPAHQTVEQNQTVMITSYSPEPQISFPVSPETGKYSPETGHYSPEPVTTGSVPGIEVLQMSEESNSGASFDGNGEFYMPVPNSGTTGTTEGVQLFEENSFDANYYNQDTTFTFSYE